MDKIDPADGKFKFHHLDYLVSASQEHRRDRQSERLGGLQIDDEL
jgi:hypothetical protein